MTELLLRETRGVLILVASLFWLQFLDIAQAEDHDPYAKIRVRVSDKSEIVRLHQLGVDIERAGKLGKDGITCIARGKILERLRSEGISFEVMVPDLERFYVDRLTPGPANALGFGYGSMGGYYTLDEIRQQLDSLRHMYPGVVGVRDSIGTSLQGRPIWAVRMTANPDVSSQRPQVLYFAMQHAREPGGMMTLLYFMWYLAEHYGQDPDATYLLQNRDLWFIPIVNVDGYEANRRINPNGGGMRRKNMRNVSYDGDDYGVDLNRNWGAEWGYDDLGSSVYPLYDDYRGTGPFSEPETQVVRDFFKGKSFRFVIEYHSYWNTTSCPPNYIVAETPDSLLFRAYIRELTRDNHYANGMSGATYVLNGAANDWLYENPPSQGKTFPFLTEVGGNDDGFWPATSRILPIASENLKANLFAAWAGGAFAKLESSTIVDSSGDGDLSPGERFTLQLRLRNFGQDPTTNTSISAFSASLQISAPTIGVGSLAPHADTTVTVQGRVPPGANEGLPASIVVTVKPGGQMQEQDTVRCIIGRSTFVFADGAESDTLRWSFSGGWGRTRASHAGQWSFTDSPSGNYPNNSNSSMRLLAPVHIPEAGGVSQLRFWSRWESEPGYDYGQVGVSSNGGGSWINVYGEHASVIDRVCYTGWQPQWVEESIDLSDFAGKDILLRFVFVSDAGTNADGWYVDDITIRSFPLAGLSYAHDVRIFRHSLDTIRVAAKVENPLSHPLKVTATLSNGVGEFIDSLSLKDDGLHGDSLAGDGLWACKYSPAQEGTIHVTLRTDDPTAATSRTLQDIAQILFTRKSIITVSPTTITLGLIPVSFASRDTLFTVSNTGFGGDSIHVKVDSGSVSPSGALAVHPTDFLLRGQSSRICSVMVSPAILPRNTTFSAMIIVDSDSGFGQTRYEIPLRFRVITGVLANGPELPGEYLLDQNYPNPFNPSTTIRYGLPHKSAVELTVYNALGQQVATLVHGEQEAGYHEVKFEGSGLSSGVYFYRLRAGDFLQTKKLLLVR